MATEQTLPTITEAPVSAVTSWALVDEALAMCQVAHYLDATDPATARAVRLHALKITSDILGD